MGVAREYGLTDYELYYQSSESTDVEIFKHEVNEFSSSTEGGVCLRCVYEGKMGYASTEELSAQQAADIVRRAVNNAMTLETEEKEFLVSGGQEYEKIEDEKYELPTTEELIKKALEGQEALYAADKSVIDGTSAGASKSRSVTAIYNSRGLDLYRESESAAFMAAAVVTNGSEMSNDYNFKRGRFDEIDVNEVAKEAVENAVAMLGADVAPTGAYPVVFAPKAMRSMLAAFSGIFSAENTQKGLSRLGGRVGETVASEIVTLVDDPFCADGGLMTNFDAEGSPTHKKNVIENGQLKTLLYNLKTAAVEGVATTGNASKAGYDSPIGIRPFTMYIMPGDKSEDDILAGIGHGVYITSLGGLHAGANVISGDFSLQSSGFMIENGKKGTPVKSFTVAGNFYGLLKGIKAVASELKIEGGFASPAVLVEGLTVAGK